MQEVLIRLKHSGFSTIFSEHIEIAAPNSKRLIAWKSYWCTSNICGLVYYSDLFIYTNIIKNKKHSHCKKRSKRTMNKISPSSYFHFSLPYSIIYPNGGRGKYDHRWISVKCNKLLETANFWFPYFLQLISAVVRFILLTLPNKWKYVNLRKKFQFLIYLLINNYGDYIKFVRNYCNLKNLISFRKSLSLLKEH